VRRVHAAKERLARLAGLRKPGGGTESAALPAPSLALGASVLVLNRLYLAVHVVGVRRAFALLCRELAEVIHFEQGLFGNYTFDSWRETSQLRARQKQPHEDWIRAVNFEIQVPRVIRLLEYDRLPRHRLHLNRRNILARDGHQCQYCGRHFAVHQLSLDHVLPRSRGGATSWENVVCACLGCNVKKGGRTPHEAKMKLVRRPGRPQRNPVLVLKLNNPKYESWRTWLDGVYWEVGAKD
jgi:5-methylcytosine-specific restriction endonuclease McrA